MSASDKFFELANVKGKVQDSAIAAVYDQLEPLAPEALIGKWKGSSFDTGHPAHQRLLEVNWAGKDFHSVDDVDPVLLFDENGQRKKSDDFGDARIREVKFRGVVTAAMIYDKLPIIDTFRQVTKDVVLGAMDAREFAAYGCGLYIVTALLVIGVIYFRKRIECLAAQFSAWKGEVL